MLKVTHRWRGQFDMQLSHLENSWSSLNAPSIAPIVTQEGLSITLMFCKCHDAFIPIAHCVVYFLLLTGSSMSWDS